MKCRFPDTGGTLGYGDVTSIVWLNQTSDCWRNHQSKTAKKPNQHKQDHVAVAVVCCVVCWHRFANVAKNKLVGHDVFAHAGTALTRYRLAMFEQSLAD